jgi:hypothetical protein
VGTPSLKCRRTGTTKFLSVKFVSIHQQHEIDEIPDPHIFAQARQSIRMQLLSDGRGERIYRQRDGRKAERVENGTAGHRLDGPYHGVAAAQIDVELLESATGEQSPHWYPPTSSRRARELGCTDPDLESEIVIQVSLCSVSKVPLRLVDWAGGSEVDVFGGARLKPDAELQRESTLEQPVIWAVIQQATKESFEDHSLAPSDQGHGWLNLHLVEQPAFQCLTEGSGAGVTGHPATSESSVGSK